MSIMPKANTRAHHKTKKTDEGYSPVFTSGFAQSIVFVNGILLTLTAFFVFNYLIQGMSTEHYSQASKKAGSNFVDGISQLEDSMRLVSSIILLAEKNNKESLAAQIRRNVPNLNHFDQLIWLYEEAPGLWQFQNIYERSSSEVKSQYWFKPNTESIRKLVTEKLFETKDIRVLSDFAGMNKTSDAANEAMTDRSFALAKTMIENDSALGMILGITRASLLVDKGVMREQDSLSGLTIRDVLNQRDIYTMYKGAGDKIDLHNKLSAKGLKQNYDFLVGDAKWQVVFYFAKQNNVALLEKVPYLILLFGSILTIVGTLFIRNNGLKSTKLRDVNTVLEQKNYELQSEIAERERLNHAIVTAEKDNRAIIDSVSDVIFETDITGNIVFLSASWELVTGFETDRSKGQDLFSMLFPEDQGTQRQDFEKLIRGQKQAYRSFTKLRISNGTFRAIELAMSMIRQDENKNLRVVGTITDVEERRRAERALAEAEKKYRKIVENAAGGIYQLTPEGIYLSANPAMSRILGYNSPEEMLRMVKNVNGSIYINESEREAFVKTLIVQGQVFGLETQVLRKNKSIIWVRENIRVVKDDSGNILYFEGSMEDITERKKADIALMEAKIQSDIASRAKTEFIANMSHELRTPLNAIIGFSDIMKNEVMGALGQDIYKEYVEDINKSGEGLLKIINEILDISKIESGNRDLNESEFSLSDVLGTCLDVYASRINEKNITITNGTKNLPSIIGEELSIKQVIGNIYSNATKYTPTNGRITLFTNHDADGCFRLSFTDTGAGMDSKEIEKALSPFGQIDNALDRQGAGTGLGLPLAQAIMEIHDGRIEILSEKSIGTTVTIIFPAHRVKRQTETAPTNA